MFSDSVKFTLQADTEQTREERANEDKLITNTKKTHINIREMGGGVGGANLKDFDGPISHCGVHLSIVLVAQVND